MGKSEFQFPEIALHLLLLPLLPIAAIILGILWALRQLIGLWLQVKLGDQFGGLLGSSDRVYIPRADSSRKLILILSHVRSDTKIDIFDKLKANVQKRIFSKPNSFVKLISTQHCFLGQEYLLKNQVTWNDIGKRIPLPSNAAANFDEEYIKKFMGSVSNSPLPINDTALWELHIATEPLIDKRDNGYTYPVLLRIHHAVADGMRLLYLLSVLCDGKQQKYYSSEATSGNLNGKNISHRILKLAESIVYFSYLIFIGTVTYLKKSYLKSYDKNVFQECSLTRENLVAWAAENEKRYVSIVKEVKSTIPNTKFSDVLFTCISASLFNYFKKHGVEVPKNISCLVPMLLTLPSIDYSKTVELRNDYTLALLDLPIVNPNRSVESLKQVMVSMEQMRQNPDKNVIFLLINYISAVIPAPILNLLQYTRAYTSVISNVPGISHTKLLGNCELTGIVGVAPHTAHTGITFTIFTYDNKFHICILVDKAIIPVQEDAQFIVDDIFRNMDILYKNCLRLHS